MSYDTIHEIQNWLEELDRLIKETKARLPAHSVKPAVMMDLLDLEDEYEQLMEKLKKLKAV